MLRRLAVLCTTAVLAAPIVAGAAATTPAGAAITNKMTVTMREYAFVVDGKLRPGQAEITVKDTGKEAHILAMFKLKPGVDLKQIKATLKKSEKAFNKLLADPEGAYGYPFILTPGGESTTITDLFSAGKYVMICFLQDAKGKPHFLHGMYQLVTISGKPVKPQPVESDATVTITDDSITAPPSPAPSTVTVKVDNQGTRVHSLAIIKLNGDATLPDVDTFFEKEFKGGPFPADAPGEIVSGVGDIKAGKSVYLSWKDLPPGRYGYASISGGDEKGQGDDFSKGLYGEFTIA